MKVWVVLENCYYQPGGWDTCTRTSIVSIQRSEIVANQKVEALSKKPRPKSDEEYEYIVEEHEIQ